MDNAPATTGPTVTPAWCLATVAASALIGLGLIADQSVKMSATYDEVTYLRVAARWWRTGEQDSITRLGTPLTFWKIQQAPTLWALDRLGCGSWIDDPIAHQAELLPIVRIGESWIWLASLLIAADWARKLYGPPSMALASVLFLLSPNLLAHGALTTMEMPLVASSSAMLMSFWTFLKFKRWRDFLISALLGGLAFSCKFTAILIPPILGLLWVIDLGITPRAPEGGEVRRGRLRHLAGIVAEVALKMTLFLAVMFASDLVITGFSTIPMSPRRGDHPGLETLGSPGLKKLLGLVMETPLPNDWSGFGIQAMYQQKGGLSYLFGERRMTGWKHYYLVTLAVKIPLAFWVVVVARAFMRRRPRPMDRDWVLPVFLLSFLFISMMGSKRNYGYRYLLPMETPAIVWASCLASGSRLSKWFAGAGLAGMAVSLALIHPHELAYFNEVAGGPIGGRKILSDSNLDWGQGAKALAKLQRSRPELRDLTFFYFGDTDPAYYGVEGKIIVLNATVVPPSLPPKLTVETKFLAVSASLQWGPWEPEGYFQELNRIAPIAYTEDTTIAIYRTSDLESIRTGRGPE